MFVTLRYVGSYRRRITWNSMGECFCYVVNPGETFDVPASQAKNAAGAAPVEEVGPNRKKKVKRIRKIVEKESSEVVTKDDELVFEKQDRLDPFENCEADGEEVVIELDEDDPTEELLNEEQEEEVVEEEATEEVVTDKGTDVTDKGTDFVPWNKRDLCKYIIEHSAEELKESTLMRNGKDTLIAMCVALEESL